MERLQSAIFRLAAVSRAQRRSGLKKKNGVKVSKRKEQTVGGGQELGRKHKFLAISLLQKVDSG